MRHAPTHRGRLWRRFLPAAVLGVAIELAVHWAGHSAHLAPVVALENWGMDVMTRLTGTACGLLGTRETEPAVLDVLLRCSGGKSSASPPLLVEVDDAAWRDPSWAGGEPERVPKGHLGDVVFRAFELGAQVVVLDVLIEEGRTSSEATVSPDLKHFVEQITHKANGYDRGRRLVLVRSERSPLPEHGSAFLGELRRSAAIDANQAVMEAVSRREIVLAAPYFQVASDRTTRDWELFRVTCEPLSNGAGAGDGQGRVRVVPSVQLLVAADQVSRAQATRVPLEVVSPSAYPNIPCTVQPRSRDVTWSPQALDVRRCLTTRLDHGPKSEAAKEPCAAVTRICNGADNEPGQLCDAWRLDSKRSEGVRHRYWNSVKQALSYRHSLPDLPPAGAIGNRIIFRLPADTVDRISVLDVGAPRSGHPAHLERLFRDRIVVVGQTHAESADFFDTPVGRMPGALLLVNAIDSMNRHGMARSLPSWLAVWVAPGLFIFIVAYCFARWNSAIGTFMATLAIIVIAGLASFAFWARGGWLSFVAPLIGIQIHSWWARYEERHELDHLKKATGGYGD